MNGNATRFVRFGAGFLGLVILGWVLTGQAAKPDEQGVPTDWTHQHVIFSQPSTAEQASLVERDPRYWQQWYRRNVTRVLSMDPSVPAADASMEFVGDRPALNRKTHQDWSVNMGTGATVGAGNFAAKYSFSTSVANCASAAQPDFVVFSTGLQSAAGTASIVAYDNLYSGCTGIAPATYWAYNTTTSAPGTIKTSPIISLDGSQIAFVQTDGVGHGYLVLLKWAANNGTLAAPVAPTLINNLANYPTCVAPCMAAFALRAGAGVGVQHDDTTSSVFYDYTGDNLWVGDSLGLLHEFHPVFVGPAAPAEVGSPWPVQVNPVNPSVPLSSPVYDHRSGNIFVGDGAGYLESINATTGVSVVSAKLDFGIGIVSGPVIDISAEKVYAFASSDGTTGCAAAAPCAAVYEFSATGGLATSTKVTVGVSSATPNPLYFGAFDSAYLSSNNATGNIYVCGNTGARPILYRIPINAGTLPVAGTAITNVTTAASTAACSPVTDVANPNLAIGSTENLFLSPQLNGRPNACAAQGCLISFASTPWQPSVNFALGQEILSSKLHIETVVVAGTSGATAPTWTTTVGATVTDGFVTWMDQGALSAGAFQTWASAHPYASPTRIVDSNGYVEVVTGPGTSGGSVPTWPTTAGATTTDNSVTWTNAGFLPTTAILATGGTSGVIMDNTVGTGGASQVYYSILGSQACGTGGTGGCAVQTSQ